MLVQVFYVQNSPESGEHGNQRANSLPFIPPSYNIFICEKVFVLFFALMVSVKFCIHVCFSFVSGFYFLDCRYKTPVIQDYAPTTNDEEAEVERFYEDL